MSTYRLYLIPGMSILPNPIHPVKLRFSAPSGHETDPELTLQPKNIQGSCVQILDNI